MLGAAETAEHIELDFARLRRVSPAGLTVLASRINGWRNRRCVVKALHLSQCLILPYLQRMDLLKVCGLDLPESFVRHEAKGRFVPVRPVDYRVEEMGSAMALCVAPGGDEWGHPMASPYDLVWYVLTEMANNVRQHSAGRGYVAAQVGQLEGMVRLAIADNGMGVLQSFQRAGLAWSAGLDDVGAIRKALEPRISSRGSPTNEGVGLTLTARLAAQAGAWLLIVSGQGFAQIRPNATDPMKTGNLPDAASFAGTLVALTFRQDSVKDFALMLDAAKREAGLLHERPVRSRFFP